MDTNFSSLIDSAASVLVLLPVNPTFDTVCAGVSLAHSIQDKKPVTVSCPSPMMVGFNRIIGVQKITSELGNKNLTIKFKNYDAANIEKVSYDIIEGEFNLTVVPKPGLKAPTEEQVGLTFSGVSADLVILVGGSKDQDYPVLSSEELSNAKIVHIGNRGFNSDKTVMSLARPGSSISEVVARIIKDQNLTVDADTATNFLMGIEEGSNNFAGSEVGPDTFELFAFLLRSGGRRVQATKLSPMNFPAGSIPTQPFNRVTPLGFPALGTQPAVMTPAMQQAVAAAAAAGQQFPQAPQETDAMDVQGTRETEQDINPPDDWLQPKVYKGTQQPAQQQPQAFSENKG